MKYIDCPQCKNKIIDRTPLKCLYCGYDSSKVEVVKLEKVDAPKPPKRENYVLFQFLAIMVSLIGALVFLITLLSTHTTVIDGVLVENVGKTSTIRLIAGVITVVAFFTFLTTNRSYEQDTMIYNNEMRRISDINQKIEAGASLEDFDESDWAIIIKAQEEKKPKSLNQKYPSSIYYK